MDDRKVQSTKLLHLRIWRTTVNLLAVGEGISAVAMGVRDL
jgi:hypothetical protein